MLTVGIDPGIGGAIARLDNNGGADVRDMPIRPKRGNGRIRNEVDPKALRTLLRELVAPDERVIIVMEALNKFAGGSVQTMGSLEATKAVIATVCELSGFPVELVTPQRWQGFYGIRRTATEDTKRQSLRIARELYGNAFCPRQNHDGRADAILIAHWAQRNLT